MDFLLSAELHPPMQFAQMHCATLVKTSAECSGELRRSAAECRTTVPK
jgi:hypothetical protein